jgi:hypothetical protein
MPEIGDASTGIEASRRFFGMSALGTTRKPLRVPVNSAHTEVLRTRFAHDEFVSP